MRGDKINFSDLKNVIGEAQCNKETISFLLEKAGEFLAPKVEDRLSLVEFIPELLDFYSKSFKNAEDLLWCKFFDEEKYES